MLKLYPLLALLFNTGLNINHFFDNKREGDINNVGYTLEEICYTSSFDSIDPIYSFKKKTPFFTEKIARFYYPFKSFRLTSRFGYRKVSERIKEAYKKAGLSIDGEWEFHKGIDLAVPLYTPVKSPVRGYIKEIGKNKLYGNYIILSTYKDMNGNSIEVRLAHLDPRYKNRLFIYEGMAVDTSTVVGYVGLTGVTTGPHIHYEAYIIVRNKRVLIDPLKGWGNYRVLQRK